MSEGSKVEVLTFAGEENTVLEINGGGRKLLLLLYSRYRSYKVLEP